MHKKHLRPYVIAALTCTSIGLAVLGGCDDTAVNMNTRKAAAISDLQQISCGNPASVRPITLQDAVAVALENNLEQAMKRMNIEVARERATGAKRAMLPTLEAEGRVSSKDRLTPSRSKNYETKSIAENYTYSSDKNTRQLDLTMSWNAVDFGISYFSHRQEKHRVGIEMEQLRRLRQNLSLQVIQAYWKSAVAKEVALQAKSINERIEKRLEVVRAQIADGRLSNRAGVEQCRKLMSYQARLVGYDEEYNAAISELKELMGLHPGTHIELITSAYPALKRLNESIVPLIEERALNTRPELYVEDHERAIRADDARIALIKLFPSPEAFVKRSDDTNPLLLENYWYTTGFKSAYDLLSIPSKLSNLRQQKMDNEIKENKRLVLAIGILTQVRIAYYDYQRRLGLCDQAWRYLGVNQDLLQIVKKQAAEGKVHEGEILSTEADHFFARLQYLKAYSDASVSLARISNSVGFDPMDNTDALGSLISATDTVSDARFHQAAYIPQSAIQKISEKTSFNSNGGLSPAGLSPIPASHDYVQSMMPSKMADWIDFDNKTEVLTQWSGESWANPAKIFWEPLTDSDGILGVSAQNGGYVCSVATFTVADKAEKTIDLSRASGIQLDMFNKNRDALPVSLGLVVFNGTSWVDYESRPVSLRQGWNKNVRFDFSKELFRTTATGWNEFDSRPHNMDALGKIRFYLYSEGNGVCVWYANNLKVIYEAQYN